MGLKAIDSADSPLTAYMYELFSFPSSQCFLSQTGTLTEDGLDLWGMIPIVGDG